MESKKKQAKTASSVRRSVEAECFGETYNVENIVVTRMQGVVERDNFQQFLRLACGSTQDLPSVKLLADVYTDEQAVETRVKGIHVSIAVVRHVIRGLFAAAPSLPHHVVRGMLNLCLGVSFGPTVATMIKSLDPFLKSLRKQLRDVSQHEGKIMLCWALLESAWAQAAEGGPEQQPKGQTQRTPKRSPNKKTPQGTPKGTPKGTRKGKAKSKSHKKKEPPMLVLEDDEVLSDGLLSDEEGKEPESIVRVVRRSELERKEVGCDEEEEPFGVLVKRLEDLEDAEKMDEIQTQIRALKAQAEAAIDTKDVDISRYFQVTKGAKNELFDVVNLVNDEQIPTDFKWIDERIYSQSFPSHLNATDVSFQCDCEGDCLTTPGCVCREENQSQSAPYDDTGHLLFTNNWLIRECNKGCTCGDRCKMRVTQKPGLALQLYQTDNRGWGVRCDKLIAKGTFVAEYFGELLDQNEASLRGEKYDSNKQSYLFDLDWEFNNLAGAAEVHAEFQPSREDILTVDAFRFGGVSRFFNHSCDPNLRVMSVANDTQNFRLVHLCFFAARDLLPYEELCFDYSYESSIEEAAGIRCKCGARNCKGRLF